MKELKKFMKNGILTKNVSYVSGQFSLLFSSGRAWNGS